MRDMNKDKLLTAYRKFRDEVITTRNGLVGENEGRGRIHDALVELQNAEKKWGI